MQTLVPKCSDDGKRPVRASRRRAPFVCPLSINYRASKINDLITHRIELKCSSDVGVPTISFTSPFYLCFIIQKNPRDYTTLNCVNVPNKTPIPVIYRAEVLRVYAITWTTKAKTCPAGNTYKKLTMPTSVTNIARCIPNMGNEIGHAIIV